MTDSDVNRNSDAGPAPALTPASPADRRALLRSAAGVLIFDLAGPLALYLILRGAGASTVTALISSGAAVTTWTPSASWSWPGSWSAPSWA